jgi:NAD(P)-dependent dehydrogenase (short-subunit alcohol dehydrogenase family)
MALQGVLAGKAALVTGGAAGIGLGAAEILAREGAKIVIADLDVDAGTTAAKALAAHGATVMFVPVDVADPSSVADMIRAATSSYGRLHCAFNNAGIPDASRSLLTSDQANWDRIMNVNLAGVWHCMKAELTHMLEAGGGAIVNNSSRSGLRGIPTDAIYGAAKHGVIGLTRAAAVEFASRGVRVNAICPGLVDTALTRARFPDLDSIAKNANPSGRTGRPEEIGEAVAWLCSDASSFVTGVALPIDGGATAR